MFKQARNFLLGAVLVTGMGAQAVAADLVGPPPVVEAPPPVYTEPAPPSTGSWYIRGDLDYHMSKYHIGDYITYSPPGTGTFDFGHLRNSLSLGAGIGYQMNRFFRADITADYLFRSAFTGQTTGTAGSCGAAVCQSVDTSGYSALLLLANAYADLGTWQGITPYVGAGFGGAYLKWDDLNNDIAGTVTTHAGNSSWRFAWALSAGASYCINRNLEADVGYRFTRISGGRQFEYQPVAGPGFDHGIDVHEGRIGLRYALGPGFANCSPRPVAYVPPPEPPVYK